MDNEELDEYAQLAHTHIDATINKALDVLRTKCSETDVATYGREYVPQKSRKVEIDYSGLSSDVPNIQWLKIEEFSPEKGEEKIREFVKTWLYEDCWLYCVDLISVNEFEFDTRYRYRVRWSIPTLRHPIPRATASVYFTIEVSKITPKDFPINVYYVIEGNQLVQRPGQIQFEEKWLKDIIESKILLLKDHNESDDEPAKKKMKFGENQRYSDGSYTESDSEAVDNAEVEGNYHLIELQKRWKSENYQNYLKANEALLCLRDGLGAFCCKIFADYQSELLKKYNFNQTECLNQTCTARNIKNGVLHPACSLCSTLLKTILSEHRSSKNPNGVYWENSHIHKWTTESWEIAKIFMGRGQKASNQGPGDCDCAAILQVLNNFRQVGKYAPCTKVEKLLKLRNAIMHSPVLALTLDNMQEGFQLMIEFLQEFIDKLAADKSYDLVAKNMEHSVQKLTELRNVKFEIYLETNKRCPLQKEMEIFEAIVSSHEDSLNNLQESTDKMGHVRAILPVLEMIKRNWDLMSNLENHYKSLLSLSSEVAEVDDGTVKQIKDDLSDLRKQIRTLAAKIEDRSQGAKYKLELNRWLFSQRNMVPPIYQSWFDPLSKQRWMASVTVITGAGLKTFSSVESSTRVLSAEHCAANQALLFLKSNEELLAKACELIGDDAKEKLQNLLLSNGFSEPTYSSRTEEMNNLVPNITASVTVHVPGIVQEKFVKTVTQREGEQLIASKGLEALGQKTEGSPKNFLYCWCTRNKCSVPVYYPKKSDIANNMFVISTAFQDKHEIVMESLNHVNEKEAQCSAAEMLLKTISETHLTEIWCAICHPLM